MTGRAGMRVGILGGSFNPPHFGHLALALTVLDLGLADRVLLVPAAAPPHKANPAETPETRLAMTRLLAEEDGRLAVDDLELRREGPSYTIDTVRQLVLRDPDSFHRLVIGSDQAMAFASWRSHGELLRLAPPLVAERPDYPFTGAGDFPGLNADEAAVLAAGRFPMPAVNVNSTLVRRLVAAGEDDAALLECTTAPVVAYIRSHNLYRERRDAVTAL